MMMPNKAGNIGNVFLFVKINWPVIFINTLLLVAMDSLQSRVMYQGE